MGLIKDSHTSLDLKRNILCRLVFGCIFFLLLYELFSNALLHQLRNPALVFPYIDITYILFNLSGIQEIIGQSPVVSATHSILLFVFCVSAIIWPERRLPIVLFSILYFFYFLSYSNYGAHHIHSKIGILLITIPFAFHGKNYLLLWQGLRYYTLFIYVDAFLWKLFRGAWLVENQGILIVKRNVTPLLFSHPDYAFKGLYEYIFLNPALADRLYQVGFLAEGLFLVGFFTKKFDVYLVVLSVLLTLGFLFLADAFFLELLILNFTLIYNFKSFEEKRDSKT